MKSKSVYLAGPMTDVAYGIAVNWRKDIQALIHKHSSNQIECYSPMRYEELSWTGKIDKAAPVSASDESSILGSQRGFSARDKFDCLTCDLVFFNFFNSTLVSKGTLMEVGMATSSPSKPLVLLMEADNIHRHPMLLEYCQIHIIPDPKLFKDFSDPKCLHHYLDTSAKVISSILCPEAH